jgi:hypothetical protein
MAKFFSDRYMSREEHQEIVAYYRKLVAELHCKVQALRKEAEGPADMGEVLRDREPAATQNLRGPNVVTVNFRRSNEDSCC